MLKEDITLDDGLLLSLNRVELWLNVIICGEPRVDTQNVSGSSNRNCNANFAFTKIS